MRMPSSGGENRYSVLPADVLYSRDRVLGGPAESVSLKRTNEVVVRQPRVEAEVVRQETAICPIDQIPLVKPPNYLAPSRQAETFFVHNCVDVAAATWDPIYGTTAAITTVLSFETFAGMKTVVQRIETTVHDGLFPSMLGTRVTQNGQTIKMVAQPGDGSAITPSTPPVAVGYADIVNMPVGVHNVTREIFDRARVDVDVSNSAPTPRIVCVYLWGWIEPISAIDDRIKV